MIAPASFDEAVQTRIAMFKLSSQKIKDLKKAINLRDQEKALKAIDFHLDWTKKMKKIFPLGSQASASNSSDASSEIWTKSDEFDKNIKKYKSAALELKKEL